MLQLYSPLHLSIRPTYRRRRRRCRRRRPVCQHNTFDMGFVGSKLILGWFGSRPTAARAVGLPKTFSWCLVVLVVAVVVVVVRQ